MLGNRSGQCRQIAQSRHYADGHRAALPDRADNFQPEYYDFSAAHEAELNVANGVLRAQFTGSGAPAANRALDKMSTGIANSYGLGHPDLGCHELRQITRDLASTEVRGALIDAADALVGAPTIPGGSCAMRVATVRR